MKCQATKVYFDENVERDRKRCDADATETRTESPSVKRPESPSHPPIVFNEHTYYLCAECAKAYDDDVDGEKGVYKIVFDG